MEQSCAVTQRRQTSEYALSRFPPPPPGLVEAFAEIPDPRVTGRCAHRLRDIVVMAIAAVIAGAETWEDVADYAQAKRDWLTTFLELPNGIPSHDTFNRVFRLLKPEPFQECFLDWIEKVSEQLGMSPLRRHTAIDGKTARHSFDPSSAKGALHLLNAWAVENGIALGQIPINGKQNEITAIPKLLEMLDLEENVITIDAIGCQKEIAKQIKEGGGDYILQVKDNQPHLHEDIEAKFKKHQQQPGPEGSYSRCEEESHGHGRRERRICIVLNDLAGIRNLGMWVGLKRIIMVMRQCWEGEKYTEEVRYYIGSLEVKAPLYLYYTRRHWGIENGLHYVLDVTFREDASRVRKGHGQENLGLLRRIAITLLKQDKTEKRSIRRKRILARDNNDYLRRVLFGINHFCRA
jgi:predicted transposase YbfD/YdcC